MKLTFGKYKGKTLSSIKKNDPSYYEWMTKQDGFKHLFKPKKVKKVILNDSIPLSNKNWNDDFVWHESYPNNMNELIKEWYNTPYINLISK
jgi:hypothetical protein